MRKARARMVTAIAARPYGNFASLRTPHCSMSGVARRRGFWEGHGVKRAFVTGAGFITPVGNSWADVSESLRTGRSGIGPITSFDTTDHKVKIAGEVRGFNATDYMDARAARRMARSSQFAVAAARQAVEDAAITLDPGIETAVVMHTGGGGLEVLADQVRVYEHKGARRVSPLLVPMVAANMAASQVSIHLGIHGPVFASTAACATGIYALLDAQRLIASEEADVVIAGATEAMIIAPVVAGLTNMGALAPGDGNPQSASRPFDRDRKGFVLSEGAGAFVVESEEHADRRGATPILEILGGALTSDAFHITEPDPTGNGAALAISRAIERSGLVDNDIDYICAHGTGTMLNDSAETAAIKHALGARAYHVPISSPKSMAGHLLGAAGCISVAACMLAIADGIIPPTINLDHPDLACDLDYVPHVARRAIVTHALANGFGFGGQNSVVALGAV